MVVDIETTALYKAAGNIVEIGVVELNTDTGETTFLFNQLINEGNELDEDAWIFHNSDLTPALVRCVGKSIDEIYDELQGLFDRYYATAFNSQFDFGWLEDRLFTIPKKLEDPMLIATDILKIRNYYGYKWPKVTECLDFFGIHKEEPHRAYEDAKLEAMIVMELIKLNQYPLPEEMNTN